METTKYTVRTYDPVSHATGTETLDAASLEDLRVAVSMRGLTMLDAKATGTGLNVEIGRPKPVKQSELAAFSRMFATMVGASMPVIEALHTLADETNNPTLAKAVREVAVRVQDGSSLSAGLTKRSDVFPPLMISLVTAGEAGGFLDTALVSVAEALEANVKLRADIKSAATYPVVVLCVGILVSIAMLLFILPTFANMFAQMGAELPLPTRMAMGLGAFMKWAIGPIAIGLVLFAFWWRKHKYDEPVRAWWDPLRLRLPVFGPLVRLISTTRLCHNLSTMLSSGVPMMQALRESAPTSDNVVLRDATLNAMTYVERGERLSAHLGDGEVIPNLVVAMVKAGEKSGAVDTMLLKVAQFYDQQIEARTKQLSSMLEPILIVVIGAMIGALVVAMYMPIFTIYDYIQ